MAGGPGLGIAMQRMGVACVGSCVPGSCTECTQAFNQVCSEPGAEAAGLEWEVLRRTCGHSPLLKAKGQVSVRHCLPQGPLDLCYGAGEENGTC